MFPRVPLLVLGTALGLLPGAPAQDESLLLNGDADSDLFGQAVAGAGDVDLDGVPDLLVGAPGDDNTALEAGMVRVHSGATGNVLYTFDGSAQNDSLGRSVAGGGDVDQDGVPDFLLGAPYHAQGTGYVRVHSGATGGLLHQFTGANPADQYGFSMAFLGDVDGDGRDDYALTAVFAQAAAFEAGLLDVRSGATGQLHYTILGGGQAYWFGWSVAAAGDLDNDGFTDVLTGATADPAAGSYAGSAEVFSGATGASLMKFTGYGPDAQLGWSVAGLGDVDGDGVDDVAAGAPIDGTVVTEGGMVRVVSGATGTSLFDHYGVEVDGHFGMALAGPGDVDGDGHADLFVGAPDDGLGGLPYGATFALSGLDGAVLDVVQADTSLITDLGQSLAVVGDIDMDGVSDVAAGAPADAGSASTAGAARVYSGACFNVRSYGTGSSGAAGFTPSIESVGSLPRIGTNFRLEIADALGGAPAVLLIGAGPAEVPAPFGTLLVDPNLPLLTVSLPLGGLTDVPGAGGVLLNTTIPFDVALVGGTAYLQVLVGDPTSSGGIAHSAGLRVTVCR